MKLRTKMFTAMAAVCLLFTVALAVALSGIKDTSDKFNVFLEKDQSFLSASTTLYAQGLQMGQALRNIIMDPGTAQSYKNLDDASREFGLALAEATALGKDDPEVSRTLKGMGELQAQRVTIQKQVIVLAKGDMAAAVALLNKDETPVWRKMRTALLDLIATKNAAVKATQSQLGRQTQEKLISSLILGALALTAGAGITFWLTRHVMKQLGGEPEYALGVAAGIAGGDLSAQIRLDERNRTSLLYAIKTMQENLGQLVSGVRAGTETIVTASSEIASGNQDLSSRTEQQASSLEETASSMEELTSTVRQNADNARQANQLAIVASETAQKGGQVVGSVVHTMQSISESAGRIADIISVIDGIAFQTNILSLNAAVEAARAGEQGRGFAVVATEVRALAQRSAAAAKEIKVLIEDAVAKVGAGSKLVHEAGATMDDVVSSVTRVTDIMAEISAASQEQTTGIEQVNQAVMQMDQVTQQNAALVEEAAAAAESMQDQAARLNLMVGAFKLGRSGTPLVHGVPALAGAVTARPVARLANA